MIKPCEVYASRRFEKQLKKLPQHLAEAALVWIASVEEEGIREVRKLKGYHDEPLKAERKGQRSVRLSRGYRLFYEEGDRKDITIITILEVNKHEY